METPPFIPLPVGLFFGGSSPSPQISPIMENVLATGLLRESLKENQT